MGDQNDSGKEPGSPTGDQKDMESSEKMGPIKCTACEQMYAGPSSLRRHLWMIHRMSGEEAQAIIDASMLDQNDNPDNLEVETEDNSNGGSNKSNEKTGPIKCGACEQVYAGPSSLKRHLWRIHRLAGEEAQAVVDTSMPVVQDNTDEPAIEVETEDTSNGGGDVKPLLGMSGAPKVRPLLDFSPDPPGYQANNFGGVSPTAPWTGGSSGLQTGLLPTPGLGGQAMLQGYVPPHKPKKQPLEPIDDAPADGDSGGEAGDGKIKPLMSVGVLGEGGIPSLMSLPFGLGSGMGMGGTGYQSRPRRKERRTKPYSKKDGRDGSAGGEDNGGIPGDDRAECAECGQQFQDSADLADHEIHSHNVGIDLNCDVELTA